MNGTVDIVFLRRILLVLVLATLATGTVGAAGVALQKIETSPHVVADASTTS